MSTQSSRTVRSRTSQGQLHASASPNPFDAAQGKPFFVSVGGGEAPYTVTPLASPPNPPGVTVTQISATEWQVNVPQSTPAGTSVAVQVTDSTQPNPQSTQTGSMTG